MSDRVWIPVADVRIGDQLAHKLSDTPWTYTPVTGWSDKVLRLGGSLGDVTQRRFTVSGAPWWVISDAASLWHSLDGQALVRNLGKYPEPAPAITKLDGKISPHGEQYEYVLLDPGEGTVLRCRACGAFEGYAFDPASCSYKRERGSSQSPREWLARHVCDEGRRRRVTLAGGAPADVFGRVPYYRDAAGRYIN